MKSKAPGRVKWQSQAISSAGRFMHFRANSKQRSIGYSIRLILGMWGGVTYPPCL